jgi:FKBP-type peptidyl-prolyl cis-trans isomerase FkpA
MHRWVMRTVAVLAITLTGCASGGAPMAALRPVESIPFASSLDVNLARMTKTPSGLYYRDIEVGTGLVVRAKMDVMVHYTGWLTNGVKFDSNGETDAPITVPVGRGRTIKGWDEGLQGMRVGGRRQLVVPSELGYGSERSGQIPADAVLVFDIHVVSAKP